jgi:hypothetical protein
MKFSFFILAVFFLFLPQAPANNSIAISETAGAIGDIAVNAADVSPELQPAVNAFNISTGIIGVKNLTKGVANYAKQIPDDVKRLIRENNSIRDLLIAKYIEWNSLVMKYKSPNADIETQLRKILETHEGVLGQLAGKVLRKFDDPNEIAQFLKTEKNGAFFWSGRTSKGMGVADMAHDMAQSKGGNTLEGLLAKYNIDMPHWGDGSNPLIVKKWNDVSALYASQVSGEVRAILGKNLRPGNIWETVELPRLKNNPNVTKITTIDPETHIETIIHQK